MLQSWTLSPDYYFSGNSPTWFISDLMYCYLLFIPIYRLMIYKNRLFNRLLILVLIIYFFLVFLIPEKWVHPVIYVFPPMQSVVFLLGMALAKRFSNPPKTSRALFPDIYVLTLISFIIVQMYAFRYVTPRLSLSSYWWISAALIIIVLTKFDRLKCCMINLFHLRPLVYLGNISYSIYIFHLPILYTWKLITSRLNIILPVYADFSIYLLIVIIVSGIIHSMIERPLIKKLDKILSSD